MLPDSVSHAGPAQSSHAPHLTQSIEMTDYDDDFQALLKQLHLPEEVRDSLLQNGYDYTLTFGLAFSSMQMLDQHIQKFLPPGETDLTSPTCACIPALWSKLVQTQHSTYNGAYTFSSTFPTYTSIHRPYFSTQSNI